MDIKQIEEQVLRCNKCGFCQATCPTYKELREESACARGRIHLIYDVATGKQEMTPLYKQTIERCTLCMACRVACPSGVGPDAIILAARQNLIEKKGMALVKDLALHQFLPSNLKKGLASTGFRVGRALFPTVAKRLAPKGVDVRRFPVGGKALHSRLPDVQPVIHAQARVAFFIGCMIDYSLPDVGMSPMRVLKRARVGVAVPSGQTCCGAPMHITGDAAAARRQAERNLRVFASQDVDHIITACATCSHHLKEYGDLMAGTPMEDLARRISDKVMDATQFLAQVVDPSELGEITAKVTYHDPCHLVRGLGITEEPRKLLKAIPGVEFTEMVEADRCCGAAGLFQVFYADVASGITERKMSNIANTGADLVVSACPACQQRLQGGINLAGMSQKAVHVVELLDRAYSVARPRAEVEAGKGAAKEG